MYRIYSQCDGTEWTLDQEVADKDFKLVDYVGDGIQVEYQEDDSSMTMIIYSNINMV